MESQSMLLKYRSLAIQFHLECLHTSLTYYEYQSAKKHIKKAQELSGLTLNMTGKYSILHLEELQIWEDYYYYYYYTFINGENPQYCIPFWKLL